jgi:FeS assembly protein IscX
MPKPELKWSDADEVAFLLSEQYPDTDPLTVRFTDLHRYVTQLPDFADDPTASSEGTLEAIQMAWLEYFRKNRNTE